MSDIGPTQGPKSAEDIEKEQEAKLKAKYGNMGAKKKLMPKVTWFPGYQCTHKMRHAHHWMIKGIWCAVGSQVLRLC